MGNGHDRPIVIGSFHHDINLALTQAPFERCQHADFSCEGLVSAALAGPDQQVDVVRDLMGIPPKSELAREAGSVGPADVGGITTGQLTMGSGAADARGEPYDSYGASVVEGSPTSGY